MIFFNRYVYIQVQGRDDKMILKNKKYEEKNR